MARLLARSGHRALSIDGDSHPNLARRVVADGLECDAAAFDWLSDPAW